ncbi:hypothetical protein E1295_46580 [Nonomuraea mesophila]|uniref:Uncharacterized protein n=1 Tax=Nonomuraea mesophila TaxID=2530382 RepID=A0A4V6PFX9_9ACTN|nr:hypothetical protein [Nonomuraea mesophila]TDE22003.1 hypothetical protein E1295_46580 [Nonomuraea mesophila]
MSAGLEEMGFGLLGVPRPPDTAELERQAGVLESLGRSQASVGDDGVRAYRLAGANAGAATDALAEHVTGQAGVLQRSAAQAHSASLGAGAAQVAWKVVKWAGGMLIGLAGMAGLAALTPQGRALIKPLLRPIAQRVQQYLRTATRVLGQIYTRLAQRLRGTPAKAPTGQPAAARTASAGQRGTGQHPFTAAQSKATRARISANEATMSLDRAGERLSQVEKHVRDARETLRAAYARNGTDAATRARLDAQGLANHPYLDDMSRWNLQRQGTRLQQIETQLSRHTAGHLDDARRHVDEGLGIARANGLDASDLNGMRQQVSRLTLERAELADRAWTTRMDINGPFEIQDMYRIV